MDTAKMIRKDTACVGELEVGAMASRLIIG